MLFGYDEALVPPNREYGFRNTTDAIAFLQCVTDTHLFGNVDGNQAIRPRDLFVVYEPAAIKAKDEKDSASEDD